VEELAVVCGGSWEEYGGGAMAHGQKLHEAARHNRPLPFFWCFVLLSLLSFSSGFAFCTPCSPLSFSLKSPLVLKPVFFPLSPPLSLSLSFVFFSFFLSLVLVLRVVFIGQRGAGSTLFPPYRCAGGMRPSCPVTTLDELDNGCGLQGTTPLVSHYEGAWGFGF